MLQHSLDAMLGACSQKQICSIFSGLPDRIHSNSLAWTFTSTAPVAICGVVSCCPSCCRTVGHSATSIRCPLTPLMASRLVLGNYVAAVTIHPIGLLCVHMCAWLCLNCMPQQCPGVPQCDNIPCHRASAARPHVENLEMYRNRTPKLMTPTRFSLLKPPSPFTKRPCRSCITPSSKRNN